MLSLQTDVNSGIQLIEGQITRKNLCHFDKKNLKISKKISKISKKILKSLKKSYKSQKSFKKSLNLCHFFPSYLPLDGNNLMCKIPSRTDRHTDIERRRWSPLWLTKKKKPEEWRRMIKWCWRMTCTDSMNVWHSRREE